MFRLDFEALTLVQTLSGKLETDQRDMFVGCVYLWCMHFDSFDLIKLT